MVERKLYKTKLCNLYKQGHCYREACSFAHGEAELRRFTGSFAGRRDYRGSELTDRHSPQRNYSPRRNTRSRHSLHGLSPSRSFRKNSDKKHGKRHHGDGHSDYSESLKYSEGSEDRIKEAKSSESKYLLEEELKQVQLDIDKLEGRRSQLQIYIEGRAREADSLTSRIQELESQLYNEKDECKRITSKIKKFVKAHNRHMRIQDELNRSQSRLQKIAVQLGSDARPGLNGDDSSINVASDGEPTGIHVLGPLSEQQIYASPNKKRRHALLEAPEGSKSAKLSKEGFTAGTNRLEKFSSRWDINHVQSNEDKEAEVQNNGNSSHKPLSHEGNHKQQGKHVFTSIPSADKLKERECGYMVPSTSMAAHATDEYIDVVETEETTEVFATVSSIAGNGATDEIPSRPLPLPPPPPLPKNAYAKFQGDDENVDVDGLEDDMIDVDTV